ncbi:Dihydrolipoyllysine-residue acetyltransferase component of acetoin cleaving system [Roseivivax jejudonensis]|uniref:Dihydrolipoyllysine-residue acetyltransferase component of acetoin cleaving system n=1 Tax=Roseivivax jejudonensis TaxID=1529041 RepID=A0A1X6ZI57_9RHOB|nr:alpha/beta fold hydrolase [Roseivivax jejudonensis]SLN51790.1 Dihydrolipoyllysine-residue acetyltransferase component of acetoin cleaving system [Roseivivax jejudonensis]
MPEDVRAGHPVRWRVFGSGAAPALLLHCALAQSRAWAGLADALGDFWTATAPDMPGHGRSAPWDGKRDLHDLVTDIAASFLDRPAHLVGHSFGATVALRLAQTRPEAVRSLTLIEPVLFAAARDVAPDRFAANRAAYGPLDAAASRGDWQEAARLFTARWGEGDWDDLPEAARERLAGQMPLTLSVGDVLNDDAKGLLAPGVPEAIAVPVRLIRGAESDPIMAAVHEGLAARLPGARASVIPGAGHMVPITHAEAVAEVLRGDLAALSDGRSWSTGG